MRKLLVAAALAAVAMMMVGPASADPGDPFCQIAGGATTDGESTAAESCVFSPDLSAPGHAFTASTPNSYRICVDNENNGCADAASLLAEGESASPSGLTAGALNIPAGTTLVRVEIDANCAEDFVCGWIGQITAG